jgi:hypothetical protein
LGKGKAILKNRRFTGNGPRFGKNYIFCLSPISLSVYDKTRSIGKKYRNEEEITLRAEFAQELKFAKFSTH